MKAKVVITLTGEISVVVEEGTFEAGSQAITRLLAGLQAQGINLEMVGAVEQHRHDDPGHLARHEALKHNHTH